MDLEKRGDKKGFQLAISTLVIIVISVMVLIVLIIGFTTGWNNFWMTISNFIGGTSIKSAQQSCMIACNNGEDFDYCCIERTVRFSGEKEEIFCFDERLALDCSINCEDIICVN